MGVNNENNHIGWRLIIYDHGAMAKELREMVCISCPLGCRMAIEIVDGELKTVEHNTCKKGIEYAKQEFYNPKRMVTATVALEKGRLERVPVRTSEPLPVKHINELLSAIYALKLQAPIKLGARVIKNFAETGVDVITTRNVPEAN